MRPTLVERAVVTFRGNPAILGLRACTSAWSPSPTRRPERLSDATHLPRLIIHPALQAASIVSPRHVGSSQGGGSRLTGVLLLSNATTRLWGDLDHHGIRDLADQDGLRRELAALGVRV
jgi:hypothetical protein